MTTLSDSTTGKHGVAYLLRSQDVEDEDDEQEEEEDAVAVDRVIARSGWR